MDTRLTRFALLALGFVGGACGARTDLWVDPGGAVLPGADAGVDAGALPTPTEACVERGSSLALITVTPSGDPSLGIASSPTISRDGRRVAFVSNAADLVERDTNEELDVFVRDRETETTTRVSVATDGTEGDDASGFRLVSGRPTISGDGTLIAFPSNSDLLHPEDDNGRTDIYVHSLVTGETRFVPVDDPRFVGGDSPVLTRDGRFVVFAAFQLNWSARDAIAAFQPVRVELSTGATEFAAVTGTGELADEFDDLLSGVSLIRRILGASADGRFVTFASASRNLDAVFDRHADIFVSDLESGTLTEVTDEADDRSFGPSISADGRFVAFTSSASSYPDPDTGVYVRDRLTGALEPIPDAHGFPVLSEDGRFVTFFREGRIHVFDRGARSVAPLTPPLMDDDETQGRPVISGDGCWVTFLWSRGVDSQVWVARNPLR